MLKISLNFFYLQKISIFIFFINFVCLFKQIKSMITDSEIMAIAAIPEILGALEEALPFLVRIFRAVGFLEEVSKVRKLKKVILTYNDVKSLVKKDKKVKDYVLNQLFKLQLKSNHFVFFSEYELINFIRSRDADAKILKLLETKEVDLYLVEGRIFNRKWQGLLNYFTFALLLNQFNLFEANTLNAITTTYNELHNELLAMRDRILQELDNQKANDIANTYCVSCSCCCSCTKGSCCCSCDCTLVHYVQAWDNLRSYIENQFQQYDTYLNNQMINQEENSLLVQFIALFDALMNYLFIQAKEKYLFAVVKEKAILENIKKEKKKTGVLKAIYEYLKHIDNYKVNYNDLVENLQNYLYWKLKKNYTKKQVQILLNTAVKTYNLKIKRFKDDKGIYWWYLLYKR